MEIKCKILYRTPSINGISQAGNPWQKQILICETVATYPKKVALTAFNSTVETMNQFPDGTIISAVVSVESREFNGKWYTDVYVQNAVLEQVKQPIAAQTPTQVMPQATVPQAPQVPQSYPQQMQQTPQAQPYAVQASQPVQKQQVYPLHIQQLLEQPLPAPSRVQFVTQPIQQSAYTQIEDLPF